jgi:hypothetical protein
MQSFSRSGPQTRTVQFPQSVSLQGSPRWFGKTSPRRRPERNCHAARSARSGAHRGVSEAAGRSFGPRRSRRRRSSVQRAASAPAHVATPARVRPADAAWRTRATRQARHRRTGGSRAGSLGELDGHGWQANDGSLAFARWFLHESHGVPRHAAALLGVGEHARQRGEGLAGLGVADLAASSLALKSSMTPTVTSRSLCRPRRGTMWRSSSFL